MGEEWRRAGEGYPARAPWAAGSGSWELPCRLVEPWPLQHSHRPRDIFPHAKAGRGMVFQQLLVP